MLFTDITSNFFLHSIFKMKQAGNISSFLLTKNGVRFRSSHPEVSLRKGVLKICSKFTGEHPCRNVISIKLQSISIEIPLLHWYPLVNLLYIIRTPFHKNTSGGLLVSLEAKTSLCKSLIRQLYFYRLMVMLVPLQLWYYELIVRILYSD